MIKVFLHSNVIFQDYEFQSDKINDNLTHNNFYNIIAKYVILVSAKKLSSFTILTCE